MEVLVGPRVPVDRAPMARLDRMVVMVGMPVWRALVVRVERVAERVYWGSMVMVALLALAVMAQTVVMAAMVARVWLVQAELEAMGVTAVVVATVQGAV